MITSNILTRMLYALYVLKFLNQYSQGLTGWHLESVA
jgi:hypothetical protein